MATTWSKTQRNRAKQDKRVLVGIAIDARQSDNPALARQGGIDFCGPVTDDEARKVIQFLAQFLKEHTAPKGNG